MAPRGAVIGVFAAVVCGLGGSVAQEADSGLVRDRVLEAVVKAELRADPKLECVIILPRGFVDHSHDGGMGLPMQPVSTELLRRLRRLRPRLGTVGSDYCPDPVLWLGPMAIDTKRGEATVYFGEPAPPSVGRGSYNVRRGFLGRWHAKRDCCQE